MADFEYPHSSYPVIISKTEPFVVRVDATVLLIGSTSYSAKVKMGSMYTGFYIFVSGLGEPVEKIAVDIEGYNDTSLEGIEQSDAYKHIQDEARKWVDALERSVIVETTEKSIVELLREIKYQQHFDMSGHEGHAKDYPNLEICTDTPTYMEDVVKYFDNLNEKVYTLNEKLDSVINAIKIFDDSENGNLYKLIKQIESNVEGINLGIYDPNDTSGIKSICAKLESIIDSFQNTQDGVIKWLREINDQNSNIATQTTNIATNTENIATNTENIAKNIDSSATTISTAVKEGLASLVSQMNTMNTNIETYNARLGIATDSSDETLFGKINNLHTDVSDISTTLDEQLMNYTYTDSDGHVHNNQTIHDVLTYLSNQQIFTRSNGWIQRIDGAWDILTTGSLKGNKPNWVQTIYDIRNHRVFEHADGWIGKIDWIDSSEFLHETHNLSDDMFNFVTHLKWLGNDIYTDTGYVHMKDNDGHNIGYIHN